MSLEPTSTNFNFPSRARGLKNETLFDEFVFWYALPRPEKIKLGIETQKDFAEHNHISEHTLSVWIDRTEFIQRVKSLWKKWGKGRTPNIIQAIYNSAVGGGKEAPQAQRLWMQAIEDFSEKTKNTGTRKVEIGPRDIRAIIEALPEQHHEKFYGYIREIIEVANSERTAGRFDGDKSVDDDIEAETPD